MKRWHHLFEADERYREKLWAFKGGRLGPQDFAPIWQQNGRPRQDLTTEEIASLWIALGEKERLRGMLSTREQRRIKTALGAQDPNYVPLDFTAEGVVDGFDFRIIESQRRGSPRLQIRCPICENWVGMSASKMGIHLRRRDHLGANINRSVGAPPTRVGEAMYRYVSTKKYGVFNLYPDAHVSWSGSVLRVAIPFDVDPKERLDPWMEEKYNLVRSTHHAYSVDHINPNLVWWPYVYKRET